MDVGATVLPVKGTSSAGTVADSTWATVTTGAAAAGPSDESVVQPEDVRTRPARKAKVRQCWCLMDYSIRRLFLAHQHRPPPGGLQVLQSDFQAGDHGVGQDQA